jgi:predicted DNA-binding WGR domain protein
MNSNVIKWLNKEKHRYYTIIIQNHDSYEEIALKHSWGSCVSNRGGNKNLFVKTEQEAQKYISKMMKRRSYRGYELISQ